MLSYAGRYYLIKSVLSNLPIYYLSIFKIPYKLVKQIISLQTKFLWGKGEGENPLASVKWSMLEAPNSIGGLGFKNLKVKNLELLAKWWWKFSTQNKCLWKNVVKSTNLIIIIELQLRNSRTVLATP